MTTNATHDQWQRADSDAQYPTDSIEYILASSLGHLARANLQGNKALDVHVDEGTTLTTTTNGDEYHTRQISQQSEGTEEIKERKRRISIAIAEYLVYATARLKC